MYKLSEFSFFFFGVKILYYLLFTPTCSAKLFMLINCMHVYSVWLSSFLCFFVTFAVLTFGRIMVSYWGKRLQYNHNIFQEWIFLSIAKRLAAMLLCAVMILCASGTVFAADTAAPSVSVWLNGKPMEFTIRPLLENGVTFVSLYV